MRKNKLVREVNLDRRVATWLGRIVCYAIGWLFASWIIERVFGL